MDDFQAQIFMQMSRFLRIQNTMEDVTEEATESRSRHAVNTRLEILESNWSKFQVDHEQICRIHYRRAAEGSYIKNKTFERCQEFYVQARIALLDQQENLESSHASSKASDIVVPPVSSVKRIRTLPKIHLPKFSGDYHAWRSFHDLFQALVGNNEDIPKVEKMHYLKTCLTGDAARLVVNLGISEDAFDRAWTALVSRFENKRLLISAQLDTLSNLKPIKSKAVKELNTMIATVTECLGALRALGCEIDTWDPMIVHRVARLLDEDTREAWEIKLGMTTTFPTFKQFEEFLVGHARAWENMATSLNPPSKDQKRRWNNGKSEYKSRSLVATAQKAGGSAECQLCKSSHYLSRCPRFLSLSVSERSRHVGMFGLCYNCFGNHISAKCPSSRRCQKCGKKHHSTIHRELKQAQKSRDEVNEISDKNSANTSTAAPPPSKSEST